jgi:CDP-4-dehydro-6-deoxyglucose reductase
MRLPERFSRDALRAHGIAAKAAPANKARTPDTQLRRQSSHSTPMRPVPHFVTLQTSGKRFRVETGETVLEAARRAGLALPYSCLAGVCGSCKATLIEGDCVYPRNPPSALNAAEQMRHQILLCQAVPASNLVIAAREVASVADIPRRVLTLKLVDKALLGNDVAKLSLLTARGERLRRLPGQYLDVLLPDGKRRAFSIANAPHDDDTIELHVRRITGGGFTTTVFDELKPGALLRVEGPLGTFVPREDSERPMLLMAGGTGFAPIKALVEHFLHLGTRRAMTLYWGARVPSDLYLRGLPERWARDVASFRFVPVISDAEHAGGLRAGLVHEALLEDHADLADFDLYMSGPPTMIDAGRRAFVDAGLPEERLYYDSFDYAPDVIAEILGSRAGIHGL